MTAEVFEPLAWGALFSAIIAAAAYARNALDRSGALAATCVGALIFGLGGWQWGVLLVVFFVTSSGLSRFRERDKGKAEALGIKGSRRDAVQVLANGGVAATIAVISTVFPSPAWQPMLIATLATVTADTWATELGSLSPRPPRLVTSGRVVPAGTSGAVSWPGTIAAIAGATVIGGVAAVIVDAIPWWVAVLAGTVGGTIGAFADSVLGATVQGVFVCDRCGEETEKPAHRCGHRARLVRGWPVLGNDGVNVLASVSGAATGWLIWLAVGF